jgi:hypothetical protein
MPPSVAILTLQKALPDNGNPIYRQKINRLSCQDYGGYFLLPKPLSRVIMPMITKQNVKNSK